ncbi:hypothetical protein P4S63_19320 [Pseudoalteromonas sp. B193]
MIDPTLISSKEHVLIILISLIRDKVSNERKTVDSEDYKSYEKALKELAGGLCQIDGIGASKYGDEWEDKSYILETGLNKASEGRNLESKFNLFLLRALKILGKRAFVVTFDDIDTQFERGWPVLETVRKYLTSPRLVVLISGDIELYSTLVRAAQLESLGKNVLEYERPSQQFHSHTHLPVFKNDKVMLKANELEEQYMMKVLKPENRVHMLTLHQKATRSEGDNYQTNVIVTSRQEDTNNYQKITLEKFLDRFLINVYGVTKESERISYYKFILNLPSRTLLQIIKAIKMSFEVESVDTLNNGTISRSNIEQFSISILGILGTAFNVFEFRVSELSTAQYSWKKLVELFWKWESKKIFGSDLITCTRILIMRMLMQEFLLF